MIRSIQLRNFKAFQDTGEIELKPITVLAGVNSGGKSSVLQGLLLLKQTLEDRYARDALNIDGRFVSAAALNDLAFGKPPLRGCRIGYRLVVDVGLHRTSAAKHFPSVSQGTSERWVPLRCTADLEFGYRKDSEGRQRIRVTRVDIVSRVHAVPDEQLRLGWESAQSDHAGPLPPEEIRLAWDSRRASQVELSGITPDGVLEGSRYTQLGFRGPFPDYVRAAPNPGGGVGRSGFVSLPSPLRQPISDMVRSLDGGTFYLGPLREEPRRAYLHAGSGAVEIGQKGEYVAQVLWMEKDQIIQFTPSREESVRDASLADAVVETFHRLGMLQSIKVSSEKQVVYQILLDLIGERKRGKSVTIADVGFGVSQLLPIVVMGLRAPRGSLLLFEQPEIHLHPKLQAGLADFFLALTTSGRRVVVETHSDHLIHRLRRRIAEDRSDKLAAAVNILFVRPGEEGTGSAIHPLRVDPYGQIENWPPEFLPEAADEAEAVLMAGISKRRGSRSNGAQHD